MSITQIKQKVNLSDLVLGIVIPMSIALLILHKIWLRPGFFFFRDISPLIVQPPIRILSVSFYSWMNGPNSANITIFPWLPMVLIGSLTNSIFVFNSYAIIMGFIPGTSMYFSAKKLITYFDSEIPQLHRALGSALAGAIYLLASTNTGLLDEPGISSAIAYALVPVLFTVFVMVLKGNRVVRDSLLLGVLSFLGITNPVWIISAIIPMIIYFLTQLRRSGGTNMIYLRRAVLALSSIAFVNSLVIIPNVMGFVLHAGGIYSQYETGTFHNMVITPALIQSISHTSLLESFIISHGSSFIFTPIPANWTYATFLIPIIAFFDIWLKRDRTNVFLLSIAALGIFLGKGGSPPLGLVYYYVVKFSPPGLVGLTYDIFPFVIITVLAYSLLLCRLIVHIYQWQSGSLKPFGLRGLSKALNKVRRMPNWILPVFIVILLSTSLVSGTINNVNYVNTYFGRQNVPASYLSLNDVLTANSSNHATYKVMWIPTSWESPYFPSNGVVNWTTPPNVDESPGFPSQFSTLESVPPVILYYLPFTTEIGRLLSVLQVKYVIVHTDTPDNMSGILSELNSQTDLKEIYNQWPLVVYMNMENISLGLTGEPTYVYGSDLTPLFAAGLDPLNSGWILENNASKLQTLYRISKGSIVLENKELPLVLENLGTSSWIGNSSAFSTNVYSSDYSFYVDSLLNHSEFPSSRILSVINYKFTNSGRTLSVNVSYNNSYLSEYNISTSANISEIRFDVHFHTGSSSSTLYAYPTNLHTISNSTGTFQVVFNFAATVVSTISIDYWFYGSDYRALSNQYLLGQFEQKFGSGIVQVNGFQSQADLFGEFINNGSAVLRLYCPATGMYNLRFSAIGSALIHFNGTDYPVYSQQAPFSVTVPNVHISKGWHNFSMNTTSQIIMLFVSVLNSTIGSSTMYAANTTTDSPTSISVKGNVTTADYTQIGIEYSSLWRTNNGIVVPVYSGLALGIITNSSTITINYVLQKYVWMGDAVSMSFIVFLGAFSRFSTRFNGITRKRRIDKP